MPRSLGPQLNLPQTVANTHHLLSAFWASFLREDTCPDCELRLMWEIVTDHVIESMGYDCQQFAYTWGPGSSHALENFSVRLITDRDYN